MHQVLSLKSVHSPKSMIFGSESFHRWRLTSPNLMGGFLGSILSLPDHPREYQRSRAISCRQKFSLMCEIFFGIQIEEDRILQTFSRPKKQSWRLGKLRNGVKARQNSPIG